MTHSNNYGFWKLNTEKSGLVHKTSTNTGSTKSKYMQRALTL